MRFTKYLVISDQSIPTLPLFLKKNRWNWFSINSNRLVRGRLEIIFGKVLRKVLAVWCFHFPALLPHVCLTAHIWIFICICICLLEKIPQKVQLKSWLTEYLPVICSGKLVFKLVDSVVFPPTHPSLMKQGPLSHIMIVTLSCCVCCIVYVVAGSVF